MLQPFDYQQKMGHYSIFLLLSISTLFLVVNPELQLFLFLILIFFFCFSKRKYRCQIFTHLPILSSDPFSSITFPHQSNAIHFVTSRNSLMFLIHYSIIATRPCCYGIICFLCVFCFFVCLLLILSCDGILSGRKSFMD